MRTITHITLFFLLSLSINKLTAQKYAYIEQQKVLESINNYEKEIKYVDSLKNAYSTEITSKQNNLSKNLNILFNSYKITEKDFASLTSKDIQAKLKPADYDKFNLYKKENEMIKETIKNHELTLKNEYNSRIKPKLDHVNKIMETYAIKKKLDFVQIIENTNFYAYINKKLNITDEIIKLLN